MPVKRQRPRGTATALLSALLLASACIAPSRIALGAELLLRGGGSTFAAPLFSAWIQDYGDEMPTLDIAYDAIGSGEGVSRFVTGSLDFAATDAPLTEAQRGSLNGAVTQIPVTAGMIALPYNLPGDLQGQLRLSREVYGGIFSGSVTQWDDPQIVALNPGLSLPHRRIQVVARLDGSGTTFSFTEHLEAVSRLWQETGLGTATRVDWPGSAILARGNEGVAVNVMRSDGSIGYVEYGFAERLGLPLASLENRSGAFVAPDPRSGRIAIESAGAAGSLDLGDPDPAAPDAYPIVAVTWMLLRQGESDTAKARAIRDFARWALGAGQELAPPLGYVALGSLVREKALSLLNKTEG